MSVSVREEVLFSFCKQDRAVVASGKCAYLMETFLFDLRAHVPIFRDFPTIQGNLVFRSTPKL